MYIVDFFRRVTRRSNIPVLIYLVLNVFVIAGIIALLFGSTGKMPFWLALIVGILVYGVSLVIALSPFGEWILRLQTGCRKITDQAVLDYMMPLFNEVYSRALRIDPALPRDVQLFMNDDESPNAFATGRKTVCITRGLLQMPPEQIKATLAHEFGHLSHKDTDLILLVSVGNMIVSAIVVIIRVLLDIFHIVMSFTALFIGGSEGLWASIITWLYHAAISVCVSLLMWIWTKIGTLLVMKSSRANEYEADEFAFRLGYGGSLCALLDTIGGKGAQGLFANLVSSHPNKEDRIARIRRLAAARAAAKAAALKSAAGMNAQNTRPLIK